MKLRESNFEVWVVWRKQLICGTLNCVGIVLIFMYFFFFLQRMFHTIVWNERKAARMISVLFNTLVYGFYATEDVALLRFCSCTGRRMPRTCQNGARKSCRKSNLTFLILDSVGLSILRIRTTYCGNQCVNCLLVKPS